MRRVLLLTCCLLLAAGCGSHPQASDPREVAAIAAIEELGGQVEADEERPQTYAVRVNFAGTNIGDDALVHLKDLTELEEIDLSGTQVTDIGMSHLKGLTGLKRIRLNGTRVSNEGVDGLRQAIVGVVIER